MAWTDAKSDFVDYRTDFVGYANNKCGMDPVREQAKIMRAMTPKDPYNFQIKLLVISGHNIGKTAVVGVAVPWFYESFVMSRTITTAPNYKKQVERQSWAEVHKWGSHLRRSGVRLLDTEIKDMVNRSHFASGVPSDAEEDFRGFHERSALMMIFEEGVGIEDRIYKAAEGSQQWNYIYLIISNPGAPHGYVYDIAMGRKKGWEVMWFNSEEAELPDPTWIQQMREDYGEDSPTYAMRVLGRFPDIGEDSVHGLSHIEVATGERDVANRKIPDYSKPDLFLTCCDVAEWGSDLTVITGVAVKIGKKGNIPEWVVITNCQYYGKQDVDFTKSELMRKQEEWVKQFKNDPIRVSSIDRIGVGSGAYSGIMRHLRDLRRELGHAPPWRVIDFVGSASASDPVTYANVKAESQFTFSDWLKAGVVYFAPNIDRATRDRYKGDLLVYKYDYDKQSRYLVLDPRSSKASKKYDKSEKLDIKSPDFGDTLGQAAYLVRSRRGIGRNVARNHARGRKVADDVEEEARPRRITPGDLLR